MEIRCNHITKEIKGIKVLDKINLSFQGGKIYGLQGKNGCGKTMLMRAICGLIKTTSGTIEIDGKILHKQLQFPPKTGVLIENPAFLAGYTGRENLKMLCDLKGKSREEEIEELLKEVGLNPQDRRTYKKYSLGMRQRLGIAFAAMESPKLMILDEPFNALDDIGVEQVRHLILSRKEEGCLVIMACHDRTELENLADHIIKMENGRVVDEG